MMNDEQRAAIEQALALNQYTVDKQSSHLRVKDMAVCHRCADRPCIAICPAAVYEWEEPQLLVLYEGCLECGACRVVCPSDNIDWSYPRGGFGVSFKNG